MFLNNGGLKQSCILNMEATCCCSCWCCSCLYWLSW